MIIMSNRSSPMNSSELSSESSAVGSLIHSSSRCDMTGVPRREVLIVDDNVSDREAIVHALRCDRSCRYGFHHAGTGSEALELIHRSSSHFDLIILDWHLPDITGLEFVRSLRGNSQIPP